jgi:hypothetical protein
MNRFRSVQVTGIPHPVIGNPKGINKPLPRREAIHAVTGLLLDDPVTFLDYPTFVVSGACHVLPPNFCLDGPRLDYTGSATG